MGIGLALKWKDTLEKLDKIEGDQVRQLVVCALKNEFFKVVIKNAAGF